jgi:predicted Zn-dependent peptidase
MADKRSRPLPVLLLVAAAVVFGQDRRAEAAGSLDVHISPPTRMDLPNGLHVLVDTDRRAPVVSMQIRYDVGSRDDPPGKAGLASLTNRMLVRRTAHLPDGMYDRYLARAGAAWTGWNTTVDSSGFWTTVPTSALPLVLWLWSDQMGFFAPAVDQALIDAQRATLANERRQRVESGALSALREMELEALYPRDHPYHYTPLRQSLDEVTARDVVRFFDEHYAPDRALLVLSGDVDASVLELVTQYFGAIPRGAPRAHDVPPVALRDQVRLDVAANVRAPVVSMVWPTPATLSAIDLELKVVAKLLSSTGLLVWDVVDRQKVATSITAQQLSHQLGSEFEIQAHVAPGHTADEVVQAIDRALASIVAGPVSDELIAKATVDEFLPRIFEMADPAGRVALYASYGIMPRERALFYLDMLRSLELTPQAIHDLISRFLVTKCRVLAVVQPDLQAPEAGILRSITGPTGSNP